MSKLTREDKIKIYELRKEGYTIPLLSSIFSISHSNIEYLVRLIDKHGYDILRKNKNRYYTPDFKVYCVNRVLKRNESIKSVAIDIGLCADGILHNWIYNYKNNNYTIIEKLKGRKSMKKIDIKDKGLTPDERLKQLEKKIQYLEAENEYLKKLNVVVENRVKQQKKKGH